jgi:hypothetical protein
MAATLLHMQSFRARAAAAAEFCSCFFTASPAMNSEKGGGENGRLKLSWVGGCAPARDAKLAERAPTRQNNGRAAVSICLALAQKPEKFRASDGAVADQIGGSMQRASKGGGAAPLASLGSGWLGRVCVCVCPFIITTSIPSHPSIRTPYPSRAHDSSTSRSLATCTHRLVHPIQ